MSDWPKPDMADPQVAPHYHAAAQGRLEMQRCASCGQFRWPAARFCPDCLTEGGAWTALAGSGTLWSFAVYEKALHPAFEGLCPYAVGLVRLEEGPTVYGRLEGDPAGFRCGQQVEALFVALEADIGVVRFRAKDDHGL